MSYVLWMKDVQDTHKLQILVLVKDVYLETIQITYTVDLALAESVHVHVAAGMDQQIIFQEEINSDDHAVYNAIFCAVIAVW